MLLCEHENLMAIIAIGAGVGYLVSPTLHGAIWGAIIAVVAAFVLYCIAGDD